MSRRNLQRGFSQSFLSGGIEDARQKLIRGRIQDARHILNKKAQLKNKGFPRNNVQKANFRLGRFTAQSQRFGLNRTALVGKIRNQQNVANRNMRVKLKNEIILPRRKLLIGNQGKQIKLRGGSIQVTAKQSSVKINETNDELEDMTLMDLQKFTRQKVAPAIPLPTMRAIAEPTQMLASAPIASTSTYTILVSNLHPSVTEEDIKELFGAVGNIASTRFLHPGAALVSYFSKEEALSACNSYHNRLLDSQPMQCSLLSQSDQQKGRASIASRLGGRLSTQSPANNYARVALSQFMPSATNQRLLPLGNQDPIFSVRLS